MPRRRLAAQGVAGRDAGLLAAPDLRHVAVHDPALDAELRVQRLQRGGAAQRAQERLALLDVGGEVERRARLGVELGHARRVGAQVGVAERRRLHGHQLEAGRRAQRVRVDVDAVVAVDGPPHPRDAGAPQPAGGGRGGQRLLHPHQAGGVVQAADDELVPAAAPVQHVGQHRRADRRPLGRDVRVVERVRQPVLAVDRPHHQRGRRQCVQRGEGVGRRNRHALQHEHGVGCRRRQPRTRGRAALAAVDELGGDHVHGRQRGGDRGGEAEAVGPQVDARARLPERPVGRDERDPRPGASRDARPRGRS